MKITRRQLKQIIKEELAQVLQEFDPQLGREAPKGGRPSGTSMPSHPASGGPPTGGQTRLPGPSDPSLYGAEIGATVEEEESIMRDLAKRREEEAQMRGLRGPEREEYWNKRLGGPYIG